MFERFPSTLRLIVIGGSMTLLSACAFTTSLTDGTSDTLKNTTDASSDFTSSTSPRHESKDIREQRVSRFASANLDRLREDMARGGGEHLATFAHLLGVTQTHEPEFFTATRNNYPTLFRSERTTSDEMLSRLYAELDANPGWRQ